MTTTNTIEIIESDERCISSLVESEILTLNERINKNTFDLCNYLKHNGGKGRILILLKVQNFWFWVHRERNWLFLNACFPQY